jgi:predicted transposase YbfD/YdcC
VITICGLVAGCEGPTDIAEFGKHKESFLRKFLKLPNGIPSHDTFSRVFRLVDPAELGKRFMRFGAALHEATGGKLVALDGKTARRSYEKGGAPLHVVSAWCTDIGLSLGQEVVDGKSNEIMAIPELLEVLDLEGAVVTIDAEGCQRAIATKIREKKADYVLTVKANQPTLRKEIEAHFQALEQQGVSDDASEQTHSDAKDDAFHVTCDRDHGRDEVRSCHATAVPETMESAKLWRDLKTIAKIESRTTEAGKQKSEVRYVISSLPPVAATLGRAVRKHWGIENSLHWVLDVTFDEDRSRICKDNGPQNFAALRRLAVTLLKQEPTKRSIAGKRLIAAWDNDYLFRVLTASKMSGI